MKRICLISFLSLLLCSCASRECRIHGTVTEDSLEGVQIFLVTDGYDDSAHVDSVYIKDLKFEFITRECRMADLRVDWRKRDGIQNLLVATEPGDIFVTIGKRSSSYGTPLNDSLQVWKNLTMDYNIKGYAYYINEDPKEKQDSLKKAYITRTHAMADAVGEDSVLGKFLYKLYPR